MKEQLFIILALLINCAIAALDLVGDCFSPLIATVRTNSAFEVDVYSKYYYEYTVSLAAGEYCTHEAFFNFELMWSDATGVISTVTTTEYVYDTSNSMCYNEANSE
jgi:hypothetical protein